MISIIASIASILGLYLAVYHEIKSTTEEKENKLTLMFFQLAILGFILIVGGLYIGLQMEKLKSDYIIMIFSSCILFYPIILVYQTQIGLWFFYSYKAPIIYDLSLSVEKLRNRIYNGRKIKRITIILNFSLYCLADFCFISLLIIMNRYSGVIGKSPQLNLFYYISIIFLCFSTRTYLKTIKSLYFHPNVCCITLNHAGREEFSKAKLIGQIIKKDEHNYILKGHAADIFVNKSMIKSVRESESYSSDDILRYIFKYTTELYELLLLELTPSLEKSIDIKEISEKSRSLLVFKELEFIQIDSDFHYIKELALYDDFIMEEKDLFVIEAYLECINIYYYINNLV